MCGINFLSTEYALQNLRFYKSSDNSNYSSKGTKSKFPNKGKTKVFNKYNSLRIIQDGQIHILKIHIIQKSILFKYWLN